MVHVAAGARISRRGGGDLVAGEVCDCRGMMVLFVKQVHLQKDGGAMGD